MSGIFKKTQDISWQDQTTFPIEQYLSYKLNDVIVTADIPTKSRTILLQAGHSFIVGEYIEICHLSGGFRPVCYHSRVTSVSALSITVGKPIGFPIVVSNILSAKRTTTNLNVDGSVTPFKFDIEPPNGTARWDLTRTIMTLQCSGQPDDSKFGDIAGGILNGIYFGIENDRFNGYLVNIIDNAGFRGMAYDVIYVARTLPAGSYGIAIRKTFAGQEKYGVAIRLNGAINEKFVCYVQDNLSTLLEFRIKLMGHEVD